MEGSRACAKRALLASKNFGMSTAPVACTRPPRGRTTCRDVLRHPASKRWSKAARQEADKDGPGAGGAEATTQQRVVCQARPISIVMPESAERLYRFRDNITRALTYRFKCSIPETGAERRTFFPRGLRVVQPQPSHNT